MTKQSESERLLSITQFEREYWQSGVLLAGMDEAGRGPLAGPVVAACVILPQQPLIERVNDSKKLSPKRREELYEKITALGSYGVGIIDNITIDEINILQATRLAFKQAFEAVCPAPAHVLVDAVGGLDISATQTAIIKGDAKSYLIAAASIIAKVTRDRLLVQMDEEFPQYGFARNKGYGTAEHIRALKEYGACAQHRRSFIGGILGG